ncbi:hypothetical protein L7F22_018954 [Adiantum nelumboides]|nr:hypothetical protein [Adiantum nelumboides]
MADTTKRARSPSQSLVRGNDSKRTKEEEQNNHTSNTKMADEQSLTKNEESDNVDLGTTQDGEDYKGTEKAHTSNSIGEAAKQSLPAGTADLQQNDSGHAEAEAPPANISMRALIVTGDASIIIGKAGKHINEIREKSGAKLTISESLPGNPERILTVAGALDAVSKAFGLIVRRINDEPFDQPSIPAVEP